MKIELLTIKKFYVFLCNLYFKKICVKNIFFLRCHDDSLINYFNVQKTFDLIQKKFVKNICKKH